MAVRVDASMLEKCRQSFVLVAQHHNQSIHETSKLDFRKAREAGVNLPVSLSTCEAVARLMGGWLELRDRMQASQEGQVPLVGPTVHIPDGHIVKGVSTFVGPDGETRGQWIKTTLDAAESREAHLLAALQELPDLFQESPQHYRQRPDDTRSDLLAVYPMGDPHVGMYAWGQECGTNFDLTIAEHIMKGAINELAVQGPKAGSALIINLGDFFHSDWQRNVTQKSGHQLDVDGRWVKVLQVGLQIMVHMIEVCLSAHDAVTVINVAGNHDEHTSMMLSVALASWYRNEPRVAIHTDPANVHYHVFGQNLIGTTHGDKIKANSLESLMAADRPKDWGNTRYRYWYTGHVHHTRRQEERGCIVEVFRTLAARDAYAASHGYRSGRDMHRITLHKDHGEIARNLVTAQALEHRLLEAHSE